MSHRGSASSESARATNAARSERGAGGGAAAGLVVWKLFRVALGLAGCSIGVGPFSLGLGIFFYEAKTPEMKSQKRESESTDVEPADETEQ